jgi:hypothetical protein
MRIGRWAAHGFSETLAGRGVERRESLWLLGGMGLGCRAWGKGQTRVSHVTHGLDVDHHVLALRRLAKVPLAELSEAMVHRALLMAADMIEMLGAEAAAAAWKEEQERRRGSLSTAPH